MKRLFISILIGITFTFCKCESINEKLDKPKYYQTLIVSFDGLRNSKLNEFILNKPDSTFAWLINNGVRAEFMKPSFPSATFPNHYRFV